MLDYFNREIDYLRISVTNQCNLRCTYCIPDENYQPLMTQTVLSAEQIALITQKAVELGITKIRLTGGEPLIRNDIVEIVERTSSITGIKQIGLTTNGVLLQKYIKLLVNKGLTSVNISLDTLAPHHYSTITRGGSIEKVLEGIKAAIQTGLPVKINMVVMKNTSQTDIDSMAAFCSNNQITLQRINHFDLQVQKESSYQFDRPPDCEDCNRIRLLSDGTLKPCLHSNISIKVDFDDIAASLRETILAKPQEGCNCTNLHMYQIGG